MNTGYIDNVYLQIYLYISLAAPYWQPGLDETLRTKFDNFSTRNRIPCRLDVIDKS